MLSSDFQFLGVHILCPPSQEHIEGKGGYFNDLPQLQCMGMKFITANFFYSAK